MAIKQEKSQPSPLDHDDSDWQRAHELLRADSATWRYLQFAGLQAGMGGVLEDMRICPSCGSSIYRPVSQADAMDLLSDLARVQTDALRNLADQVKQLAKPEGALK